MPSDISEYKRVCNEYCAMLKRAKRDHYSDLIQGGMGDSQKLFQIVNSLCKERADNSIPPHVCAEHLANNFGEFFCRKIELVKEDIGQCSIEPPTYSIPTPVARLQSFVPISDEEMRDIIMSASRASCQLDPMLIW